MCTRIRATMRREQSVCARTHNTQRYIGKLCMLTLPHATTHETAGFHFPCAAEEQGQNACWLFLLPLYLFLLLLLLLPCPRSCLAPSCLQYGLLRSTWSCVRVSPSSSVLRDSSPSPQVSTSFSRSACPARRWGNPACAGLFVMTFVDHLCSTPGVCVAQRGDSLAHVVKVLSATGFHHLWVIGTWV